MSSLENRLKYFLIQRVASVWFIWLALLSTFLGQGLTAGLRVFAIALKLGIAPFHGWFVSVVSRTSLGLIFILSTFQKFIPLLILSLLRARSFIRHSLVFFTLVSVFLIGLGQVTVRKVLVISSLNNVRWIFLGAQASPIAWVFFLRTYGLLLRALLIFIQKIRAGAISHRILIRLRNSLKLVFIFLLLSLGGLPPFLGFFNKLLIIKLLLTEGSIVALIIIVFSSLLLLFYYISWWFFLASVRPAQSKPQAQLNQSLMVFLFAPQRLLFIPVLFRVLYL